MNLSVNIDGLKLDKDEIKAKRGDAEKAIDALWDGFDRGTDWVKMPMRTSDNEMEELIMTAIACQDSCGLFVVIGNGGTVMGTRGVVEAIDENIAAAPEMLFVGDSMNPKEYAKAIEKMRHYDVNVCAISKSGETPETIMGFEIIREAMFARYGDDVAPRRIMIMTGEGESTLRDLGEKYGCGIFNISKDYVGNYGVLSPASLFPMAVAGVDIKRFVRGCEVMATDPFWDIAGTEYAIARKLLCESGKKVEIFQYDNPNMDSFATWVTHLFAESEGKDGQGLFTTKMSFGRDFKAMGQLLRGKKTDFFHTEIATGKAITDLRVPEALRDKVEELTVNELNMRIASKVRQSFLNEEDDTIKISIPEINEFNMGLLVYFFLTTAAICGQLNGVDPFERQLIDSIKDEIRF